MTAKQAAFSGQPIANLRPFDIRRDLLEVADLVEECFRETLDADGRLYIEQMRRTARSNPLVQLASAGPSGSLPMAGYVWVDQGRVVGNLSLIDNRGSGPRTLLIANVAVHPDYRRQGIAKALTRAALEQAQRRHAEEVWLQVDENNAAAIHLYEGMGFVEVARRSSWRARPGRVPAAALPEGIEVIPRRNSHWRQEKGWLQRNYPETVRWNLPFEEAWLDPGWRGAFQRMVNDHQFRHWSALQEGRLQATLSWQSSSLNADRLWLARAPKAGTAAVQALLQRAMRELPRERELALNFPAGEAVEGLEAAGLQARRTLIWMRLEK